MEPEASEEEGGPDNITVAQPAHPEGPPGELGDPAPEPGPDPLRNQSATSHRMLAEAPDPDPEEVPEPEARVNSGIADPPLPEDTPEVRVEVSPDDGSSGEDDDREQGGASPVTVLLPCSQPYTGATATLFTGVTAVRSKDCAEVGPPGMPGLLPDLLGSEQPGEDEVPSEGWFHTGPGPSPASTASPEEDPTDGEPASVPAPAERIVAASSEEGQLTPGEPSEGDPLGYVLAAAIGTLLLLPLIFLYRRLAPKDVLTNETRQAALEIVEQHPGATAADIAERLGVDYRTATHHLEILCEFGEVEEVRQEGRVRYFENHGAYAGPIKTLAAALASPARATVVETLAGRSEIASGEVAKRAGIAPSTASHHLSRLVDAGLAERQRSGRRCLYTLTAETREALVRLAGERIGNRSPT